MKYIFSLIVFLLFSFPILGEDLGKWEIVDTFDIKPGLSGIMGLHFVDSLNGMFLVDKNLDGFFIRRTTDAGATWKDVYIDTTVSINRIIMRSFQYPSKELAIAVGDSGIILRSTDNGDTWEKIILDSMLALGYLSMYDEKEGYLTSYRQDSFLIGTVYLHKTTDGGLLWSKSMFPQMPFPYVVYRETVNKNLIMGEYDVRIDSNDPYLTSKLAFIRNDWTEFDSVVKPRFCHLKHFIDENTGWIAGDERYIDSLGEKAYRQLIYHTSDGGKTWETQRNKFFHNASITEIKFYDENFGIAGSEIRWVLMTFDGGKTWNEIRALEYKSGAFNSMRQISIPTPNVAYVFSKWPDEILKWTRTPTSKVEDYSENEFVITPNPASDYIEINIPPLERGPGGVAVFDVIGIEVLKATTPSLRDTPPYQGGESVRIDVSGLAPGVYFVNVGEKVLKFVKM